jgi:hypothetical protein
MYKNILGAITILIVSFSCNSNQSPLQKAVKLEVSKSSNVLSMKLNGNKWTADNEIFGAFHPPGYNKAILITGNKGVADKNQQAFNINLYNANGVGEYNITEKNADYSAVQLGNLSTEHYLYGSILGFSMKVNIIKCSSNPTVIEATFSGELNGNASNKITITDGVFSYHE